MVSYHSLESLRVVMWSCHEDHHSTDNNLFTVVASARHKLYNQILGQMDTNRPIQRRHGFGVIAFPVAACLADLLFISTYSVQS